LKEALGEWLASRIPAPPENLLERMRAEIERLGISGADVSAQNLADAGASILKSLDERGCSDRSSALDLLAADALFTYAFEAASQSAKDVDEASRYVLDKVTGK
jgi:hypothetical protein